MDPLTAFGLFTNVLAVVGFSAKLVKAGLEIGDTVHGSTVENAEIEAVTATLKGLGDRITVSQDNIDGSIEDIAAKCKATAVELLNALSKLKSTRPSNTFRNLYYGLKTVLSESDIQKLRSRLNDHESRLKTSLLILLIQQQSNITPAMIEDLRSDTNSSISQLKADILHEIRDGRGAQEDSEVVLGNLLGTLAKRPTIEEVSRQIREQLRFTDQDDRAFRIPEAHSATFRWIFEPQTDISKQKWSDFPSWLEQDSESSLYWITGKAGSGKSTLMKFLTSQPECEAALHRWTGPERLLLTKSYLWSSGSSLQQSQQGLLRSIIYQALDALPHLTPELFPIRCTRIELFGYDKRAWTTQELTAGFDRLLDGAKGSYKLCLFIDGLDEYTSDCDLDEIVQLCQRAVAMENVKACVSSRPWPIFEEAFQTAPSLMLQDITKDDVVRYITAQFDKTSGFQVLQQREPVYAHELIQKIAMKASGVFLWVYLVTKSLVKGMSNRDSVSDLERRLDAFPADLEDFYQRIFDSIEDFYRSKAYQYFILTDLARGNLTATILSLTDDGFHVVKEAVFGESVVPLTSEELNDRLQIIERRLNSHCKGLLEVTGRRDNSDDPKVTYLHRTAKDFLQGPKTQLQISTELGEFDAVTSMLQSAVLLSRRLPSRISRMGYAQAEAVLNFAEIAEEHKKLDFLTLERASNHPRWIFGKMRLDWKCDCSLKDRRFHGFVDDAARRQLPSYIAWKINQGCIIIIPGERPGSLLRLAIKRCNTFRSFGKLETISRGESSLPSLAMLNCILKRDGVPGFDDLRAIWIHVFEESEFTIDHWADVAEMLLNAANSSSDTSSYHPQTSQIQSLADQLSPERASRLLELYKSRSRSGRKLLRKILCMAD